MRFAVIVALAAVIAMPVTGFAMTDTAAAVKSVQLKQKRPLKKPVKAGAPGKLTGASGQTSTPSAVEMFIQLQMGPEYISTTGYDIKVINPADSAVTDVIFQVMKYKDDNFGGAAGAGGQQVTIPAHDTVRVQVTHPAGWCNGYTMLEASVIRNSQVIGKRSWSIPPSAKTE
jgi:hypothetical protein